jgi:hypothetical protein
MCGRSLYLYQSTRLARIANGLTTLATGIRFPMFPRAYSSANEEIVRGPCFVDPGLVAQLPLRSLKDLYSFCLPEKDLYG